MEDILPLFVLNDIRDRYLAGVTSAEFGYKYSQGDEDSLTGALGQALLTPPRIVYDNEGNAFAWSIYYFKLRGRGADAPEKDIGADGIFQIEVQGVTGNIIRRKGLLFQAKKRWSGTDQRLREQAKQLSSDPHKAIVVDYSPNGYSAFLARDVVQAEGNRRKLSRRQVKRLAEVLGEDFLRCRIGVIGLYYDPEIERFYDPAERIQPVIKEDADIISTHLRRIQ